MIQYLQKVAFKYQMKYITFIKFMKGAFKHFRRSNIYKSLQCQLLPHCVASFFNTGLKHTICFCKQFLNANFYLQHTICFSKQLFIGIFKYTTQYEAVFENSFYGNFLILDVNICLLNEILNICYSPVLKHIPSWTQLKL